MLIWLVETSGDLVHRGLWASWSHVNPQGGEEAKDATFKVFWVLHDVLLVTWVARIQCISETSVVVVPLHHKWSSGVVLGMFLSRPHLSRPASGVEVALGRTIEGWELGILTAVVILDMVETLFEVLMALAWLISVGLEDDVSEQRSKLSSADIVGS